MKIIFHVLSPCLRDKQTCIRSAHLVDPTSAFGDYLRYVG